MFTFCILKASANHGLTGPCQPTKLNLDLLMYFPVCILLLYSVPVCSINTVISVSVCEASRCSSRQHNYSKQLTRFWNRATFESHIEFPLSFQDFQAGSKRETSSLSFIVRRVSRGAEIRVGVGREHMWALSMITTLAYFYIHNTQAYFCSDQCVCVSP